MSQDCSKSTAGGAFKAPVKVPKNKKILNEEEREDEEPEPPKPKPSRPSKELPQQMQRTLSPRSRPQRPPGPDDFRGVTVAPGPDDFRGVTVAPSHAALLRAQPQSV
jgi:hypothetical protein